MHTIADLSPGEFTHRASLLFQCYRSEVGKEPKEPYLLDPAKQVIRFRPKKEGQTPQPVATGVPPAATVVASGGAPASTAKSGASSTNMS